MLFSYDLYFSACAMSKSLHRMPFGSARKYSFNETSEMIYTSLHAKLAGPTKKKTTKNFWWCFWSSLKERQLETDIFIVIEIYWPRIASIFYFLNFSEVRKKNYKIA